MGDTNLRSELQNEFQDVVKAEEMELSEDIKEEIEVDDYAEQSGEITIITLDSTDEDEDLPSRCRLCATQANDMIYMFGPTEMHKNIIEKIQYCLPISPKKTDTLPQDACQLCLAKLELCYQFYKTVVEADKQLLLFDQERSKKRRRNAEAYSQSVAPCNGQHEIASRNHKRQRKFSNSDMPILLPELTIPITNSEEDNTSSTLNHVEEDVRGERFKDESEETDSPLDTLNCSRTLSSQIEQGISSSTLNCPSPTPNSPNSTLSGPNSTLNGSDSTLNGRTSRVNSEEELRPVKKPFVPTPYTPPITRSRDTPRKKSIKELSGQRSKCPCEISVEQLRNEIQPGTRKESNGQSSISPCNISAKQSRNEIQPGTSKESNGQSSKSPCNISAKPLRNEIQPDTSKESNGQSSKSPCNISAKQSRNEIQPGTSKESNGQSSKSPCNISAEPLRNEIQPDTSKEWNGQSSKSPCNISAEQSRNEIQPDTGNAKPGRIFTCALCRGSFNSGEELRSHRQCCPHPTKNERKFICDICENSYTAKGPLVYHMRTHTGERPWTCDFCPKKFIRKADKDSHHRTHTDRTISRFDDQDTDSSTNTSSTAPNSPICPEKVSRQNEETSDSESSAPLITRIQIKPKKNLSKEASGKNEKPSGNISTKQIRNRRQINSAKKKRDVLKKPEKIRGKSVPITKTRYACEYCEKSYVQKGRLAGHLRTHTEEEPLKFKLFPKRFTKRDCRHTHHLTHTGEKPFSCNHCDKTFLMKIIKDLHERTHTAERPHACSRCKKSFARADALKSHLCTHNRLERKPYRCDLCTKRYSLKRYLVVHKEKAHKIN